MNYSLYIVHCTMYTVHCTSLEFYTKALVTDTSETFRFSLWFSTYMAFVYRFKNNYSYNWLSDGLNKHRCSLSSVTTALSLFQILHIICPFPQGPNVKQTVSDTEEEYSPHDKDVRLTLLEEVILVGIKDKEVGFFLTSCFQSS